MQGSHSFTETLQPEMCYYHVNSIAKYACYFSITSVELNFTCYQIGDFGMARDLMQDEGNYYTSSGGIIPIKWTAPEVGGHTLCCVITV